MGIIISCALEQLFYLRSPCEIVPSKNHYPLIFSKPSLASAPHVFMAGSKDLINCYLIILI